MIWKTNNQFGTKGFLLHDWEKVVGMCVITPAGVSWRVWFNRADRAINAPSGSTGFCTFTHPLVIMRMGERVLDMETAQKAAEEAYEQIKHGV